MRTDLLTEDIFMSLVVVLCFLLPRRSSVRFSCYWTQSRSLAVKETSSCGSIPTQMNTVTISTGHTEGRKIFRIYYDKIQIDVL